MKVGGDYNSFNLSSQGLSLQRKKMDLIAQNIANAESTRTENGKPYKRKYIKAEKISNPSDNPILPKSSLKLQTTNSGHIMNPNNNVAIANKSNENLDIDIVEDNSPGELIFMPNHPDADDKGYVEATNVNIINEMVAMIEATRNYEANLKVLNASKEIIKDSLEI